jgi:hypothetical protein
MNSKTNNTNINFITVSTAKPFIVNSLKKQDKKFSK